MAVSFLRDDRRIVIHVDYDCFYASVFEAENPILRSLPLAVQQKQIVVTCNYEARRRGLRKLQPIKEAKRVCPDVVVVLGEDLSKFRDVSKRLYGFLSKYVWCGRIERLGFDEETKHQVFLDVTEIIDFNAALLNRHDLENSFFHLNKLDPTIGFVYDANRFCGRTVPESPDDAVNAISPEAEEFSKSLNVRLALGSHLALYLRNQLKEDHGYSASVGVSTSKLLAKLVGHVNKPDSQTTLLPPYVSGYAGDESSVTRFLDPHDISKVPGIGFKLAHKLRTHVLGREPNSEPYSVPPPEDKVMVRDVRLFAGMGPTQLDEILGGPGSLRGIGNKVWELINGIDHSKVAEARALPTQISIEDTYGKLDSLDSVRNELRSLAGSLIRRMRLDLTEVKPEDDEEVEREGSIKPREARWLAYPRTLRLSTRLRATLDRDNPRGRPLNRVSRSAPTPSFIFSLGDRIEALAERLVEDSILTMFRKIHPEKSGWNLSLINIAVTNMLETAGGQKGSIGQDIGKMLGRQESVLKDWAGSNYDASPPQSMGLIPCEAGVSVNFPDLVQNTLVNSHTNPSMANADDATWLETDDEESMFGGACPSCGVRIPHFAMAAHKLYHTIP